MLHYNAAKWMQLAPERPVVPPYPGDEDLEEDPGKTSFDLPLSSENGAG